MPHTSNLALVGYGKMGRLIEDLAPAAGFRVGLKLDEFNNENGVGMTAEAFDGVDVAIDFSIPDVVADNAVRLCELGVNTVIGTTGWLDQLDRVTDSVESSGIGLVHGANFSVGVNAFYDVVEAGARAMSAAEDYDAWAWEAHHKMKLDAPSGTMLRLVDAMKPPDMNGRSTSRPHESATCPGHMRLALIPKRTRSRCVILHAAGSGSHGVRCEPLAG